MARAWVLEDRPERRGQLIAVVQDVFGDRTDRRVAERCCCHIAAPIALCSLPARMVRFTVALDDQPAIDDEVDPPDTGNALLHTDVASERAQDEPHECLGARLRAAIQQPLECSVAQRQASKHLPQV